MRPTQAPYPAWNQLPSDGDAPLLPDGGLVSV